MRCGLAPVAPDAGLDAERERSAARGRVKDMAHLALERLARTAGP